MELKGRLAKSLAGHDKDSIYVIIEEKENYVYLSDGKYRLMDNPKKKKVKHIEIIEYLDKDLFDKINNNIEGRHEEIKRSLKCYKKDI